MASSRRTSQPGEGPTVILIHGGGPGAKNRVVYQQDDGEHTPEMAAKLFGAKLKRGQRVRIESPGGGGYGPPAERAREAVENDLRLGLITPKAAHAIYGYDR